LISGNPFCKGKILKAVDLFSNKRGEVLANQIMRNSGSVIDNIPESYDRG